MTPGRKLMVLVERISGIVLPDRELQRLTNWAEKRAALLGFKDTNAYVEDLRRRPDSGEWRVVLNRVTVQESSLYRAPQQFTCLRESVIPELVAGGRQSVRVWSAGCARGEEPASLAVVLTECLTGLKVSWSVLGTDVDPEALETARRAQFSHRSVRRVPKDSLERYFSPKSHLFELNSTIRARLQFALLNLIHEPLEVPGKPFDVIFLRNVLIYFRRESQIRVVQSVQENLAPGGFLFVGPSESLIDLAPGLKAEERQGVFVYRKRVPPLTVTVSATDGNSSVALKSPERGSVNDIPHHQHQPEVRVEEADPIVFAVEGYEAELRGEFRNALRCYRAALYLKPELFQVRYRLACCLVKVGWAGRAEAEFRAVDALMKSGSGQTLEFFEGPDFPESSEMREVCRLTSVRDDSKNGED